MNTFLSFNLFEENKKENKNYKKLNTLLNMYFDDLISTNELENLVRAVGGTIKSFNRGYGRYSFKVTIDGEEVEISGTLK
jgi:hypothetical protein